MLKLVIDDRERLVIPHFKEDYENVGIEIEVKRLQIGDYMVLSEDDKILFIIERKSWTDLAASIKDGRKININKLKECGAVNKCKVLYLLEGKARYVANKRFSHIPFKNLQSHIDHLIIRDNVYMIHSNDEQDSAVRLIEFVTNFLSIDPLVVIDGVDDGVVGENITLPEKNSILSSAEILTEIANNHKTTDLDIIYNIWSAIPNITSKTATLFIDKGYTISDLILGKLTLQDISTMRYPNGTIIGKRANKIHGIKDVTNIDNIRIYYNIISAIPGLTKKSAAMLLTKISFQDLLNGTMTIQEIADIKKTEKKRIGNLVAERIYKFLL
jgi:ERCC4-type nuclease